MISRDAVFQRNGIFWSNLGSAIKEGVRDRQNGFDRLAFDRLDPRLEGGAQLSFALSRALAQMWRTSPGTEPMEVCVMAGTIVGGALRVREILPDQWPLFESIHMVADGEVTVTSEQSITRRLRVDDGKEEMEALFGEANLPGDVVLLTGLLSNLGEHLMSKAAEQIQEKPSGAGILFLFQPNAGPVDILDAGGPMRNSFHAGMAAARNLSESHLSRSYLSLINTEEKETWYDQGFRTKLMEGLAAGAVERGMEVTKMDFLNALAEGSPLRRVLPSHLTRFFPEAERLFWCLQEGVYPGIDPSLWDECSPVERLEVLCAVKEER